MKNLVFILASLCVLASATSVFQSSAFLQIKEDPFGRSVAALVEMNMGTSDSGRLDAIAEVLNTVSSTLQGRSAHNDDEISRERGWCNDQQTQLNGQIEKATNDLSSYEAEQESLETQQADTEASLENEKKSLAENETNLENTQKAQSDENERYQAAAKDYSEAIAAAEEAVSLLGTLQVNPSGFLQSKARFGNVVSLLEKHLKSTSSPLVQPVLSVLAELATSSQEIDQSKLAKIVNLIQQLLSELRNQQADNESKHTSAVSSFNEAIDNLNVLISNSKATIEHQNGALDQIAARLAQLVDLISSVTSLLETLNGQLKTTQDTCSSYETDYVKIKSQVDQQIATLDKLKQYFLNQIVPSVQNVRDESYQDNLNVTV